MKENFTPSGFIRWSMYILNAVLILASASFIGLVFFFKYIGGEPMWTLTAVGLVACFVFIVLNFSLARSKLLVDSEGMTLKIGFFKRKIQWNGAVLEKELGSNAIIAARLFSKNRTKSIYINSAWFDGFERAMKKTEELAFQSGGKVIEKHG